MSPPENRIAGQRAHGGVLLVPCLLLDTYRYWFLVDTGAATTMVTQRVAEEIGLKLSHPLRRQRVTSVHKSARAPMVRLSSLQLGSQRVTDLEVLVLTLPANLRFDGILGVNFLEQFHATFDFNHSILVLR